MDIQLTQILFQIVNFSVVVGALTHLLYKPVLKIFDDRAKKIEEGQKAAEAAIKDKEDLEKTKKKMESSVRTERAKVLNKAQDEAKERSKAIIAKAQKEIKEEKEKLIEGWEKEKAQLLKDAKAEMTDAVIAISAKVIGKALDMKAQQKLIDEELNIIVKNI